MNQRFLLNVYLLIGTSHHSGCNTKCDGISANCIFQFPFSDRSSARPGRTGHSTGYSAFSCSARSPSCLGGAWHSWCSSGRATSTKATSTSYLMVVILKVLTSHSLMKPPRKTSDSIRNAFRQWCTETKTTNWGITYWPATFRPPSPPKFATE